MPNGIAEFRRLYPAQADKIDRDVAIAATLKAAFWAEVDTWSRGKVEDFVKRCCTKRQYAGLSITLPTGERLGTAQKRDILASGLSRQKPPRLPAMLRGQVIFYLGVVERDPDRVSALATFKRHFSKLRLRTIRGGKVRSRIFAFRNSGSPANPLVFADIVDAFANLAIPAANAADYLMLGYRPGDGDLVHQPTCFDANIRNLNDFVPGGKTAGGTEEIITTPPRCIDVTHAPQSII
jgi:hypothetical protein